MKKIWKVGLLFLGIFVLAGCTRSFVTIQDKSNMMVNYENGIAEENKTNLDKIIEDVNKTGVYFAPSNDYFDYVEHKIVDTVKVNYGTAILKIDAEEKTYDSLTKEELLTEGATRDAFKKSNEYALVKYAKEKTTSLDDLWSNYDLWRNKALDDSKDVIGKQLTLNDVGTDYFYTYMKNSFNAYANKITACITPEDGTFDGLKLEGKSWGEAFAKVGFIEGLLVWPIAAMLYYFAKAFSGLGEWGTILSILLVTVIVRGVLLLLTFRQTASQQKMTQLQPELAKIQEKYPNADTNQYDKQMMAQEQMALYKKYKINPFGMLIVLLFQFPIFIAVWGAMSGSAILRVGNLWGLNLSAITGEAILHWSGTASWVALTIFIIMALSQAVSMLLPQFLQKRRTAKVSKMGVNPAKNKTNNQMMIMNIVMLVMIIFTGTQLPVAMAIYWIITALISLLQSLVISHITNRKLKQK